MAKVTKREETDKTVIYMIVGFCIGALIALIFFEYYWIGVGGGIGMLLAILVSTFVDYKKAKEVEEENPKAVTKKASAKTTTKKTTAKKVSR
jgi:Ca2+/Na+ antiporter